MQKKLLGHVGVDSGQLMVTDPCYVTQFVNNEFTTGDHEDIDTSYSYNGSCNQTCKTKNQGGEGFATIKRRGVLWAKAHGPGPCALPFCRHSDRTDTAHLCSFTKNQGHPLVRVTPQ